MIAYLKYHTKTQAIKWYSSRQGNPPKNIRFEANLDQWSRLRAIPFHTCLQILTKYDDSPFRGVTLRAEKSTFQIFDNNGDQYSKGDLIIQVSYVVDPDSPALYKCVINVTPRFYALFGAHWCEAWQEQMQLALLHLQAEKQAYICGSTRAVAHESYAIDITLHTKELYFPFALLIREMDDSVAKLLSQFPLFQLHGSLGLYSKTHKAILEAGIQAQNQYGTWANRSTPWTATRGNQVWNHQHQNWRPQQPQALENPFSQQSFPDPAPFPDAWSSPKGKGKQK